MAFHEVRFPTTIALNSESSVTRRTDVVTLASGFEERNSPWAGSRRRFNAGYGVKSLNDIETVIAFFEARRGRLHGFRWRDAFDYKSSAVSAAPTATDQVIGAGDGAKTVFDLSKTYQSGGESYSRAIKKPVAGTILIALDSVGQTEGADYSVEATTGRVTFTAAPVSGAVVSAGYEFDTPVRFDTDELSINLAAFQAGDIPNIPVIEVLI